MPKIHTHNDGEDRRWQLCQCHQCGRVEECTPTNDFYAKEPNEPLTCERCFRAKLSNGGIRQMITVVERDEIKDALFDQIEEKE